MENGPGIRSLAADLFRGHCLTVTWLLFLGCSGTTGTEDHTTQDLVETKTDLGLPDVGADGRADNDAQTSDWLEAREDTDARDVAGDESDMDGRSDELAALLEAGRTCLETGQTLCASDAYSAALDLSSKEPEALLGASLARLSAWIGLVDGLIVFLGGGELDLANIALLLEMDSYSDDTLVGEIVHSLVIQSEDQIQRLDRLKTGNDFQVVFDNVPFSMHGQDVLTFHGEWDRADAYALASYTRIIYGFLCFLDSQNLDVRVGDLMQTLTLDKPWGERLALMLHDGAGKGLFRLRTTAPDVGANRWLKARQAFAKAVADGVRCLELAATESDEQSDDVMALVSDEAGAVSHMELRASTLTGRTSVPLLVEGKTLSLPEAFEALSTSLAKPGQAPVRVDLHLACAFGIVADLIHRSVGLEQILIWLGVDPPPALAGLLEAIPEGDPEAVPALLSAGLELVGIPGSGVELDIGVFSNFPANILDIVPSPALTPLGSIDFLRSHECLRLGFANETWEPGQPLEMILYNPLELYREEADYFPPVVYFQVSTVQETGFEQAVADTEWVVAKPTSPGFSWFLGSLPTADSEGATAQNGVLEVALGTHVALEVGLIEASRFIRTEQKPTGELPRLDYASVCQPDQIVDSSHFREGEFKGMQILNPPPAISQWTLNGTPADEFLSPRSYLVWRSPSINGLLWLDMSVISKPTSAPIYPFQPAPADIVMANRFFLGILEATEDLMHGSQQSDRRFRK